MSVSVASYMRVTVILGTILFYSRYQLQVLCIIGFSQLSGSQPINRSSMGLSTIRSLIFKFFILLLPTPFFISWLMCFFFLGAWIVQSVQWERLWTRGPANGVRFPAGAEIPSPTQRQTGSVVNPDHSSVDTEKSATGSYASGGWL